MDVVGPVSERTAVQLPGEAELKLLSGGMHVEESVRRLFKSQALEMIVLKRGKAAARIFSSSEVIETPAFELQEVDPTRAVDCINTGFLCGLLEKNPCRNAGSSQTRRAP